MSPEAEAHLQRAHIELDDAKRAVAHDLARMAARTAYYAAFRAAEALIVDRTGKVAKTHSGVRTVFARLWREMPGADRDLLKVLQRGYAYKEVADYGFGPADAFTGRVAAEMIDEAARFIESVTIVLSASPLSTDGE